MNGFFNDAKGKHSSMRLFAFIAVITGSIVCFGGLYIALSGGEGSGIIIAGCALITAVIKIKEQQKHTENEEIQQTQDN